MTPSDLGYHARYLYGLWALRVVGFCWRRGFYRLAAYISVRSGLYRSWQDMGWL
jgi:hypothetical protein